MEEQKEQENFENLIVNIIAHSIVIILAFIFFLGIKDSLVFRKDKPKYSINYFEDYSYSSYSQVLVKEKNQFEFLVTYENPRGTFKTFTISKKTPYSLNTKEEGYNY